MQGSSVCQACEMQRRKYKNSRRKIKNAHMFRIFNSRPPQFFLLRTVGNDHRHKTEQAIGTTQSRPYIGINTVGCLQQPTTTYI